MTTTLGPLGFTYDGSGDYSIGPANDPQVDSIAVVRFRRSVDINAQSSLLRQFCDAPEMLAALAALKAALPICEDWLQGAEELHEQIRAAIAKAEGRQP